MRAQSSIEFLTTYSFLFLILGVVVSVLIFLAMGTTTSVPQQCTSYGGPNCNFVSMYTSKGGYSLVTLSITNSQSVPINVTGMTATVKNANYAGSCTPSFLYPGQEATCVSSVNIGYSPGVTVQGFYSLNAMFCNSGVAALQKANCTFDANFPGRAYGGSFTTTPLSTKQISFSVIASQTPPSLTSNLISYNSLLLKVTSPNSLPLQPNNYTVLQNGDFVANSTSGGVAFYSFATQGSPMLGVTYFFHTPTSLFPASISSLNNGGVSCGANPPFNSVLGIASTTIYLSSSNSIKFDVETDGATEIFYRQVQPGVLWQSVFGGTAWKQQAATLYTNTVTLNQGLNDISVVWSNPCGSGGQALRISGLTG